MILYPLTLGLGLSPQVGRNWCAVGTSGKKLCGPRAVEEIG